MSQIGSPQKNILEPIASGYPSTTPAAAGESALALGQTLVDDANQETGGRDASDTTKVPKPYRVDVVQPDLPKANTVHKTITPNSSADANGNHIVDSDAVFSSGVSGGAFDASGASRGRAINTDGRVETATVLAQPKTTGTPGGYGAMSGGTPGGATKGAKVIQDLTFTSVFPGLQSNAITIEYTGTGTAGAEVVAVFGGAISVGIQSGVSTAAQVLAALLASSEAMSLVAVVLSGNGATAQVTAAATHLIGGANTPADGEGAVTNSKGSFAAINRSGSRNHASVNVIHRPGDNQAPFLY